MLDFRYSAEQLDLKRRAAEYCAVLMSYEDEAEANGGPLPVETVRELTRMAMDAGVYGINMPTEWGGAGLSLLDQVIVSEEFGKVTNCLWDIPWRPSNVLAYGTPQQRERYLLPILRGEIFDAFAVTEPNAGSDAGACTSTATRTEGGWLINGEKWFVTCGDIASVLLVQANAGPDALPTIFLMDKSAPGVTMTRVPRFMHSAVNGHPEFTFTDVFVADADVLGELGQGYELTKEWFTDERLMIAARTVGAAERALALARDWSLERHQFGRPIADFQLVQGMLADCAVDIAVNRAFTHQVAWEAEHGVDRKTLHAKASMAKLSASEAAGRVVDRCLQIFGGRGYDRGNPVERLYREVRVDRIWEGTSEIQRLIIANELVKRGTGALQFATRAPDPDARSTQNTGAKGIAMDFSYSSRQQELKAAARSLYSVIERYELDCEEHNGLPAEAHRHIGKEVLAHGLQAINMPTEWGGAGLTVTEQVIVQEELGKLTGALWDMVWRPANALRFCTPEQRERYLIPVINGERRDCYAITERDAGSDPQNLSTTARKVGGGWVLNGEKWFVTVGDHADFQLVVAAAGPERLPTIFLVDRDTPGVQMQRVPRWMHTFVYEHPEFTYTDVFVPDSSVLGEIGQGYDITRSWFTEERLLIAARTIGAAERALGLARDWSVQRTQFGQPIAAFQLIQGMLADCAVDIVVNRAFTHQVAFEADHGADRKALHAKASMAKLSASEASGRVVDRCLQIFGGRGYDRTYPVERLYRELRVDRIWEGTSEIQRVIVAGELRKRGLGFLSLPADVPS